jgi:cellulose synthase/poly-beta-1,6-N-acetylglucosamine synthase-like glycosyltransferase
VSYVIVALGKPFVLEAHNKLVAANADTPTVDVYLPICGEDSDVILNVWKAVKQLDWPADKLKVYVLDDSKTDAMREHAEAYGFTYIRREGRAFKKSGNMLNAFEQTKLCIVQTPQYFEVSSWMGWIERGAGYVQELFYRLIQQSRNHWNGTICVGSCALYRRAALESIGGFRQIEHSEDVWTGFTMSSKGWLVHYIPVNLSKGRCPDDLRAFFNQQYRWCSGSMSLCFSKEFWKSPLTKMQILCYFSGMLYYMASSLGIFFIQIPSTVMVNFYPEQVHLFNLVFYGPSFVFGIALVWAWSSYADKSFDFMRLRHMSYYAHFYALRDRLMNSTVGWVATGAKVSVKTRFEDYRVLCFWSSTITYVAIMTGIARNLDVIDWWNFLPPLFFSTFNYWLSMSTLRDQ